MNNPALPVPAPATPLPWQVCPDQPDAVIIDCDDGFTRLVAECAGSGEDAAYIVAAANAYPALTAQVTALRAALTGCVRLLELVNAPGTHDPIEACLYQAKALLASGAGSGEEVR